MGPFDTYGFFARPFASASFHLSPDASLFQLVWLLPVALAAVTRLVFEIASLRVLPLQAGRAPITLEEELELWVVEVGMVIWAVVVVLEEEMALWVMEVGMVP